MIIKVFQQDLPHDYLLQCATLWITCFAAAPCFENWTAGPDGTAVAELLKYHASNADFIVATTDEERVVAFAIGLPLEDHYASSELLAAGALEDSYYFVASCTQPEFRRRGLAASLFVRREEEGVRRGFSILSVRVRPNNDDALRLLVRFGFVVSGCYSSVMGGTSSERLIMNKLLDKQAVIRDQDRTEVS